jgi:hypothetical protein
VLAAKLRLAFCRFSLAASVPGGRCRVITHPGVTSWPGPRSHRIASARLERFDVTAPITFVLAGLLLTMGRWLSWA